MTAEVWIQVAKNSDRQAMEILQSQGRNRSAPYMFTLNAQKNMELISTGKRLQPTILALTSQNEGLRALTKQWSSTDEEISKHLVTGLCSLILSVSPNEEALALMDEKEPEQERAAKAVNLAERVLAAILRKLNQKAKGGV
ncbi:unnamed protein product [Nippostrongylus brasiliensis]|uniref:RYDR_ITPR domain-containing protein n=1 Tax=Nippostrongylus brasiliensis TaxID=27835 RepID=A0A0N4Y866_NIPBR|nr:unnamed protein product [Nippostrongylus brasiliensis]